MPTREETDASPPQPAGWRARARARRARRALDRQLAYQQAKARQVAERPQQVIAARTAQALQLRAKLSRYRPIADSDRVLEVGSGAHGYIFFFGTEGGVGVDPLADHYRALFPAWQGRARTVAAPGEALPFPDRSFDLVICDNVVDHAEDPARIVAEMARVLAPGGILYFTVNVHHPFYHLAATAHAGWRGLGLPGEIGPFADHTVHLTPAAGRRLFDGVPLRILHERDDTAEAIGRARAARPRHPGDLLKRLFFKNALLEIVALREPAPG